MIFYIASYPRSGNLWLQILLGNHFRRPIANIHVVHENADIAILKNSDTLKQRYAIDAVKLSKDMASRYPAELAEWMMEYSVPETPEKKITLASGCMKLLDNHEFRRILANDDQHYFFKTHLNPYTEFFPGEYVIQIVRNPGATLWSYYNFKLANDPEYSHDLSTLIQTEDTWGNWSEYHEKWLAASKHIESRYFLTTYEEIAAGELAFCERLSRFINIPVLSRDFRSFDYYHNMMPRLARAGQAYGWEGNYSKEQLKLLWRVHGRLMKHFGYPEPSYHLGMKKQAVLKWSCYDYMVGVLSSIRKFFFSKGQ